MNVLFMNRNSGAGVEFEGNLFISILERTIGIESIDVYKTQCRNALRNFDFSPYDLIILNDVSVNEYGDEFSVDIPIININFGGPGNRSKDVDIVMDINMPYTSYNEEYMWNYYPINFTSGNIWKDTTRWEDRLDDILYVGRLSETKIIPGFLEHVRSVGKKVKFYGKIHSNDYYEKNRDVIDYKGYVNHRELLKIYNAYKSVYLFSITECLSMTIREAILCGTVPVVYDHCNYTKAIEEYVVKCNESGSEPKNLYEKIEEKHNRIEEDKKYIDNYLSFNKMVIDFIFCLRGLLLKEFKFDKNHRNNINILHQDDGDPYESDTIDWNKLEI